MDILQQGLLASQSLDQLQNSAQELAIPGALEAWSFTGKGRAKRKAALAGTLDEAETRKAAIGAIQLAQEQGMAPYANPGQAYARGQDVMKMAEAGISPETMGSALASNLDMNPSLAAAQEAANPYGGMSEGKFYEIRDKVSQLSKGIGSTRVLKDITQNFGSTDIATSPKIRGDARTAVFSLYGPLQALNEGEVNALRASDQELIDDYIGDPTRYVRNFIKPQYRAETTQKLTRLEEILMQAQENQLVGVPEQAYQKMSPVLSIMQNDYGTPEGATIRKPVAIDRPSEGLTVDDRLSIMDQDIR